MIAPPHCPHEDCKNHAPQPEQNKKWFWKKGFVYSQIAGKIQRFQCKACLRIFSERNFHIDYRVRRSIDYTRLLQSLVTASGIRDMSRQFQCGTSVILDRISRLSKNVLAFNALMTEDHVPREDGVYAADGLESFIRSQFFPTNINILTGSQSQFVYDYSFFFFKRKGRTTDKQKKIMKELYPRTVFEPKAAARSFTEILDTFSELTEKQEEPVSILDTDENTTYRFCLKKHKVLKEKLDQGQLTHRLTNSKVERNHQNKLFPVNYIDRQIRKDMAEHVRETVQFGRKGSNAMERFTVYIFWHNFMKPFRINKKGRIYDTHAEAAGVDMEKVNSLMGEVFRGRYDYSLIENKLRGFMKKIWKREILTPCPV